MANQTTNLGLPLTLHGHVAMSQALTVAFKTLDFTLGGAGAFLGKSGVTPNLGLPLNFQGPGTMAESVRTAFKILDARIGGSNAFAAVPWVTPNLGLSMILQGHVAIRLAVADAFKKIDTAISGGSAPVLSLAANRGIVPSVGVGTGVTGAGSGPQMQRQYTRVFGNSGSRFKMRFWNVTPGGTNSTTLVNGPCTITMRGAVRVNGSAPVPWTVSAARDVVIAPGAIIETDWINIPFTTGQVLTHNDLFSVSPSIASWPGSTLRSFNASDRQEYGTGLTDRTLTDWTTGTDIHPGYTVHPWLDIITESIPGRPSILLVGDSITSGGSEDGTDGAPVKEYRGYAMAGMGADYSWMNGGCAGLKMIEAISYTGAVQPQYPNRLGIYANRGMTHCYMPLGTNDSQSLTGASAYMAMLADAKAKVEALGMKLIVTTLLPRTNAGNTAEYSAGSAASFEAIRQAIFSSGILYFDAWLYARNAGNTALWRTDLGTPTADGIHPTAAVHAAIETQFRAALPALFA